MKPSAFDGKQEATTVVFKWNDINLIDQTSGNVSDEYYSPTFGTTKTLFNLTAKPEYIENNYNYKTDDDVFENRSLKLYLNVDKNSIKKKVFIYSILSESSSMDRKSKYKNKGLFHKRKSYI